MLLSTKSMSVCLTLITLICSESFGQSPKAVIVGPSGGIPGDLLVLDSSESEGDHFAWMVEPSEVNEKPSFLVLEQGRKCIVCSVPGKYIVVLAASSADGVQLAKWTVVVAGDRPEPQPKPNPNPKPKPEPQPTPSKYGLVEVARGAVALVPAESRGKSAALADAFDSVASQIAAGALRTVEAIIDSNRIQSKAALGDDYDAWKPATTTISKAVGELAADGKLKTLEQHQEAWEEIAKGLRG